MTTKLSRERALTAALDHLHTEATELARFASKASDPSGAAIEALPTSVRLTNAASGNNTAARTTRLERRSTKGDCKVRCSGSFLDAAGANARRANPHMLPRAVHHTAHATQIRIPSPPPRVVRVADHVSKMRPLAAQFTLHRHNFPVQSLKMSKT